MEETREALVQNFWTSTRKKVTMKLPSRAFGFIALNVTRFLNRIFINL